MTERELYTLNDKSNDWRTALFCAGARADKVAIMVQLLRELYGALEAELWDTNLDVQCENLARLLRHAASELEEE